MSQNASTVQFRDIQGFPGYRVGDDGSVWSCKRKESGKGSGRGTWILTDVWKQLASHLDRDGYLKFLLSHQNEVAQFSGHVLVLTAFRGPKAAGQVARHLDGNAANNRIENLCWGTASDNSQDMLRHRTNRDNSGERNGCAKLRLPEVIEIRRRAASETNRSLALAFGVSPAQITRIIKGKRWRIAHSPRKF